MAEENDQAPDEDAAPGGGEEAEATAAPQPTVRTGGAPAAIYDIPVEITAVLGTATLQVSQLLKLGRGAVVELDRKVDEEIEVHANNQLVARAEVMVIDDRLAVKITDIIKTNRGR